MNTLTILDSCGDTELTWNHDNPEEVANIRQMVENLRAQGYSFFLVDGSPADEVNAGRGSLVVRRVDAVALLPAEPAPSPAEQAEAPQRGRGRPRTTFEAAPAAPVSASAAAEATPPVQAVAVRQMRGG